MKAGNEVEMTIAEILSRLEHAEQAFAGQELIAPLAERGTVCVRIAGVVCRLRVAGGELSEGWALLRAVSSREAEILRAASLAEVSRYLALFPAVRLILVRREKNWLAVPAQEGDRRIRIDGLVPLRLAGAELAPFETVIARFDGDYFWYDRRDPARNPAIAEYLRAQLASRGANGLPPLPTDLHKPGLTREERAAYALVFQGVAEARRDPAERRLDEALAHAGAALTSFAARDGVYTVRYQVDGREHVSTVDQSDLTVTSAGICLAGQDRRFDLASLVSVLQEHSR
jgi:hypothetical protein